MEEKPVIIIGGGLWGGFLAHRLSQQQPHLDFRLIETSSSLSPGHSWSFRESDVSQESLEWLKPFISYSWKGQRVVLKEFEREFDSGHSLVLPGQFERTLKRSLPSEKMICDLAPNLEELLEQGSFIIDTRPRPMQRFKCVRKTLGLMLELKQPHGIKLPVVMDASVRQRDLFRFMQYFPMGSHSLMLNDVRFSKSSVLDLHAAEEEVLRETAHRWEIKEVFHREMHMLQIPLGHLNQWHDGRIIRLSEIVNPITGDEFAEAVKLIDKLVSTSFRMGEVKEVIKQHRSERENCRGFSRLLVHLLYRSPQPKQRLHLLQWLYRMPHQSLSKFLNGDVGFLEVGKALLGNPPIPLVRALSSD